MAPIMIPAMITERNLRRIATDEGCFALFFLD